MIYIRAGLFAEGKTDYDFLLPLLDRLLNALAAQLFQGDCELGSTMGIDAPAGTAGGRAEQIAAAIHERWYDCTVFVVHTDGAGDPASARRQRVDPGIQAARARRPERSIAAAACVPVRELEAWTLTDPDVFRTILGNRTVPACPADPERELDPKSTLQHILAEAGARRAPERLYALFGERVRLETLRVLPAFQAFETELIDALRAIQ